ncbi:hypothetical protein ACFL6S_12315 [Candidatus Poribacteria bacterium]
MIIMLDMILAALLSVSEVDPHGGEVLRIPNFDLREPGAKWDGDGRFEFVYGEYEGKECYDLVIKDRRQEYFGDWSAGSQSAIPLLPNRTYIMSMLLNVDFERPTEVNMGIKMIDGAGKQVVWSLNGIPNKTDGWQRWEYEITIDPRAAHGIFSILFFKFPVETGKLSIADLALIEALPKELKPYAKGEGATFQGGPGNLPMAIESAEIDGNAVVVSTTGARYTFDVENDTILAEQLLEKEREIAVWHSSLSLDGLEILKHNRKECVLVNDNVTFGIQCDSLVMVVPHEEIVLTCESKIGGKWSRFAAGHMFVTDDYGGMAVNPDIPAGSGRQARTHIGSHYAGIQSGRRAKGQVDFSGLYDDQTFLSEAEPGWKINWYLSSGERLAISVFPPRPFEWEKSFHTHFTIAHRNTSPEKYAEWKEYADVVILWNFIQRTWAMSWGHDHILHDEAEFRSHIAAVKEAGMIPVVYMSPNWYHKMDAEEFAPEVKRLRNTYAIEGVYYDGVPMDWLVAYEEMRMTRELFPDGSILLHATGHPHNGGPPLGEPSLKIPAVETYACLTYTGELVPGYGRDWAYPRYVTSQYRKANCIGVMKFDKWDGLTPLQRDLVMLQYNGRGCLLPVEWEGPTDEKRLDQMRRDYFPIVEELEKLWREKGDDPEFYEKYYLPKVKELTEELLSEQGEADNGNN